MALEHDTDGAGDAQNRAKATADSPSRDELRDGLIFPEFDKFCHDNGFNLVKGCDLKLHVEAMELFDKHKPYLVISVGILSISMSGHGTGTFCTPCSQSRNFWRKHLRIIHVSKSLKWFFNS
jgi:hypothetical protein